MTIIDPVDTKRLIDKGEACLLDIREAYEREICSVESIWIPMADVGKRIAELPKGKLICILCRSGKRAEAVANLLNIDYGLDKVAFVDGGILAWIDAHNLDLETY